MDHAPSLARPELGLSFGPSPFAVSPLYSTLCPVVAGTPALLEIAAHTRSGQHPAFSFFGAVHHLLLRGAEHELARFYPSVVGDAAAPAAEAGPALIAFCAAYRDEIVDLVRTRLVQTNHVRRAVGLRTALASIAPHVDAPVHLIEIGSSAGLLLRFDRYGYRVGDRSYGDPDSPVQLVSDLLGTQPLPDLDRLPAIAGVVGVDLNPIDPTDPDGRAWLEALVWPEDHEQRRLLAAALAVVAQDPPPTEAGDASDVLPRLAETLPPGRPRVTFHCATRMHVPDARRSAFDAAIDALAATGPLWRIAIDGAPDPDPRPAPSAPGAALRIVAPDGRGHLLAVVEGHLRWIEPIDLEPGPRLGPAVG